MRRGCLRARIRHPVSLVEGDDVRASPPCTACRRAFAEERRRDPWSRRRPGNMRRAVVADTKRRSHVHDLRAGRKPTSRASRVRCRQAWRCRALLVGADAQGRRADRRHRHLPPGSAAVFRQADRAGAELRRAGRHRHRERAAAQRTAPAHRRSDRVAAAADRDLGVLEVISNSPTDSQPAFDAIVRSGVQLFPDAAIVISLPEGDTVKLGAIAGADAADEAAAAVGDIRCRCRASTSPSTAHPRPARRWTIADARDAPEQLIAGGKNFLASGYRAMTVMPMMRGEASDRRASASSGASRGRLPTSRASCCAPSPRRPSSPSRTRGCSTNCASAPTI